MPQLTSQHQHRSIFAHLRQYQDETPLPIIDAQLFHDGVDEQLEANGPPELPPQHLRQDSLHDPSSGVELLHRHRHDHHKNDEEEPCDIAAETMQSHCREASPPVGVDDDCIRLWLPRRVELVGRATAAASQTHQKRHHARKKKEDEGSILWRRSSSSPVVSGASRPPAASWRTSIYETMELPLSLVCGFVDSEMQPSACVGGRGPRAPLPRAPPAAETAGHQQQRLLTGARRCPMSLLPQTPRGRSVSDSDDDLPAASASSHGVPHKYNPWYKRQRLSVDDEAAAATGNKALLPNPAPQHSRSAVPAAVAASPGPRDVLMTLSWLSESCCLPSKPHAVLLETLMGYVADYVVQSGAAKNESVDNREEKEQQQPPAPAPPIWIAAFSRVSSIRLPLLAFASARVDDDDKAAALKKDRDAFSQLLRGSISSLQQQQQQQPQVARTQLDAIPWPSWVPTEQESYEALAAFMSAALMRAVHIASALRSSLPDSKGEDDEGGAGGGGGRQRRRSCAASLLRFLQFSDSCFNPSLQKKVSRYLSERLPCHVACEQRDGSADPSSLGGAAATGGCWPSSLDVVHHLALAWLGRSAPSLASQLQSLMVQCGPARVLDEWNAAQMAMGTPGGPPRSSLRDRHSSSRGSGVNRRLALERSAIFNAISAFVHGVVLRWHRWSSRGDPSRLWHQQQQSLLVLPSLWSGSLSAGQRSSSAIVCRANAVQWSAAMAYTSLQSLGFILSGSGDDLAEWQPSCSSGEFPDSENGMAAVVEDLVAMMESISILPTLLRSCLQTTEVEAALWRRKEELMGSEAATVGDGDGNIASSGVQRSRENLHPHARPLFRFLFGALVFVSSSSFSSISVALETVWQKWLLPLLLHQWCLQSAVMAASTEEMQLSVLTTAEHFTTYTLALLRVVREELHAVGRGSTKTGGDGHSSAMPQSCTATNTTTAVSSKLVQHQNSSGLRHHSGEEARGRCPDHAVQKWWSMPSASADAARNWRVTCRYAAQKWLHPECVQHPPSLSPTWAPPIAPRVLHRKDLRQLRVLLLSLLEWIREMHQKMLSCVRKATGSAAVEPDASSGADLHETTADTASSAAFLCYDVVSSVLIPLPLNAAAAVCITEATIDDSEDLTSSSESPLMARQQRRHAFSPRPQTTSTISSSLSSTPSQDGGSAGCRDNNDLSPP